MPNFFNTSHFIEFVFPIDNLVLSKRSFNVGKVKFAKFTKYKYDKTMTMIKSLFDNKQFYQTRPNLKKKHYNLIKENYYKKNLGETCAFVEEYGNFDNANLKAIKDVKVAINILKLYRNPGYQDDDHLKLYFDIKGEIIPGDERVIFAQASRSNNFRTSKEFYSYQSPFLLDDRRINFMKNNGFLIIDKLMNQKRFNALDKRLISAINWFGKSYNSYIAIRQSYKSVHKSSNIAIGTGQLRNYGITEPERLVFCITGLEGLLAFSNNEDYKIISKRISKIIAVNVSLLYKQLYKTRCGIVHGRQNFVDKRDLKGIINLTQNTLISFIQRRGRLRIKSVQDFQNWLP